MNPEISLIKSLLSSSSVFKINKKIKRIDNNKFIQLCREFPINRIIEKLEKSDIDPSVIDVIKRNAKQDFLFANLLIKEMVNISNLLDKEEVDHLFLKNLPISKIVGFRRTSDIDILVKHTEIEEIIRILEKRGFEKAESLDLNTILKYKQHVTMLKRKTPHVKVEIHWRLTRRLYPEKIEYDELFRKSLSVEYFGKKLRVPCWEHTLINLCVHSVYNIASLTPLRDLYSIYLIIKRRKINWFYFVRCVTNWNLNALVYFPLLNVRKLFDVDIPDFVFKRINPNILTKSFVGMVFDFRVQNLRKMRYDFLDAMFEFYLTDTLGKIKLMNLFLLQTLGIIKE